MTLASKVKVTTFASMVKVTRNKIGLTARNANSFFILWPWVFIFTIIVAYGVQIIKPTSIFASDLGTKFQNQLHVNIKYA